MPMLTESELRQKLSKDEIDNLYFFYGTEKYTLKLAVERLVKKFSAGNFPDFNMNSFANEAAIDAIADAAEALPLMSDRKCVIVSDFNLEEKNAAEIKKFMELIENISETTTLIFYYPTLNIEKKSAAQWKKWIKAAAEKGTAAEFTFRTSSELEKMIIREAEKAGCSITKANAGKIVEYAGPDIKPIMTETMKLCAFAGSGGITSEMIETMVTKSMETTVFILSAHLINGYYEKAIACLDELFYRREEPVNILAVLSSTYVDMYRVRIAVNSGKSFRAPGEYGEYKGREFVLSKAERAVKGLSADTLRKALEVLLDTDVKLKSSGVNPRILMDTLIAKLMLITKEGRR